MNEIIKLVLSLSLSGSILAIVIFVLKPFIKEKLSKSIQYYVWIVILLRLILPFSFETSVANKIFNNKTQVVSANQGTVQSVGDTRKNTGNSSVSANVQENITDEIYYKDVKYSIYFKDMFNKYSLYMWLFGAVIVLTVNIAQYMSFLKYLKRGNKVATDEQSEMLTNLLNGRMGVKLIRNEFVDTPMLIGILKPCIIIPNLDFSKKQLKNILLHEISHLRRFDIGIKWLMMIVTSIHWFNPLIYFINKEVNHACELACDEAVIKNLTSSEKQDYGDTLISVVAAHKHSARVLQATMCEEKNSLKERLVAIMNHSKKSKLMIILSGILLVFTVLSSLYLGGGIGIRKSSPPNIYISTEGEETKVALLGSYSWKNRGKFTQADSDNPINFKYKLDNIVLISGKEQLIIGTQKLKKDKQYDFTIEELNVYKDNKLVKFETVKPSFMNGNLYIQAPPDAGEYIYTLRLKFKDKGTVSYGFAVRVDMLTYNLAEISKYKTSYIGDSSKVSSIARNLPVPDNYFKQQYTSMETSKKPYSLNVYYEATSGAEYKGEWPIVTPDSIIEKNSRANALVLFCMIDNLDQVTFAFRNSQSDGRLDESKYNTTFTFQRKSFERIYGNLSVFRDNLDVLQDTLTGKRNKIEENTQQISGEEKKRIELYTAVMKAAFQEENGGRKFVAVKLDTLEGLSNQSKEEVMKKLINLSTNVYNFEKIKNDNTKFKFDDSGKLTQSLNGTLLWIEVEEYDNNRAVITGVSWFGNLGAVFPKYEAIFENGAWKLRMTSMAIS